AAAVRGVRSFPTRRSSDLRRAMVVPAAKVGAEVGEAVVVVFLEQAAAATSTRASTGTASRRNRRARIVFPPQFFLGGPQWARILDRKSTRLNSSHEWISYA